MQYYRLWIYSCNGVLGLTSAIFTVFAAFVLADVRLTLLGGVELDHPTFLYACAALILQCGVLQTIGCLGAQRLSHKLLSVYWILLLLLTIGDVVVGLVWVFKLDKMKQSLRPGLTKEFIAKYKTDLIFTATWDKVQSQEHCCGVNGPMDFDKLSQSGPLSKNSDLNFVLSNSEILYLPDSCCTYKYVPVSTYNSRGPFTSSSTPTPIPGFGSQLHSTSKATTTMSTTTASATLASPLNNYHFNYSNENDEMAVTTDILFRENRNGERNLVGDVDDGGGGEMQKDMPLLEPMLLPLVLDTTNDNNYNENVTSLSASATNLTFYSTSSALMDEAIVPVVPLFSLNKHLSHKRRHFTHRRNKHLTTGSATPLIVTTNSYDENSMLTGDTGENSIDFATNLPEIVTSSSKNKNNREGIATEKPTGRPSFIKRPYPNPAPIGVEPLATTEYYYSELHSTLVPQTVSYICQRHQYHSHRSSTPDGSNEDGKSSSTTTNYISSIPSSPSTTQSTNSPNNLNIIGKLRRRKRNSDPESHHSSSEFVESTVYSETEYSTIFSELETTTASPQEDDSDLIPINRQPTDQMKQFIPYRIGCGFKLVAWLDHVSGIMFILGFCIIGFVKTCFLVILKTEIREMISKIHMLETDLPVSPTRSTQNKYHQNPHPHPLLSNPHRASTVSAGGGYAGLPLIKSPEGPYASTSRGRGYGYTSYNRRPSNFERSQTGTNYFERERSQSHSQETVNMTLLITSASVAPTPERHPHQRHFRSNSNANSCTHNVDDTSLSIKVPRTRRSSSASATTYTAVGFPHSLSPQPGPSSRFYHQPFSTTSAGSNSSASAHGCPTSYNHPPHIKHLGVNPGAHHSTVVGGYGCNSSFSSRDENEILSVSMENLEEVQVGRVGVGVVRTGVRAGVGDGGRGEEDPDEERRKEQEIRNWVAVAGTASSDTPTRHDHKAADYGASRSHQNNSSISSTGSNERQRRNGNNNVDCNCIPMSFLGTAV